MKQSTLAERVPRDCDTPSLHKMAAFSPLPNGKIFGKSLMTKLFSTNLGYAKTLKSDDDTRMKQTKKINKNKLSQRYL